MELMYLLTTVEIQRLCLATPTSTEEPDDGEQDEIFEFPLKIVTVVEWHDLGNKLII